MEKETNLFTLSNGVAVPAIAFGTWRLPDTEETTEIIKTAVQAGYRHIDTAAKYENEASVGKAVRECGVPREELFVTSKLRNTRRGYETTLKDFDRALSVMGLDYLDLYLIHWPAGSCYFENWEEINLETWRAMEKLLRDGKARAIGVSNFWPHHLRAITDHCEIAPMVCQMKMHPGFAQPETARYCQYTNIQLEAYSPLGAGKLLASEQLSDIAAHYQKSPAQICIRWCLQHGAIPLPKSSSLVRMQQNLNVFDFTISEEDMLLLDLLSDGMDEVRDPDRLNLD